jgi:GT2 family glycosyltransferase
MPARLSVAIVTYQPDLALLRHALRSLGAAIERARADGHLSQATVFVVDNGPEAGRAAFGEAMAACSARDVEMKLLAGHGNIGYGRANNRVLPSLASDYHLVMNPDVVMDEMAIGAAVEALHAHPEIGLAAPAAFDEHGERQYLCKRYPSAWVLFLRGFAPSRLRRRFAATLDDYEMRDVIGERLVSGIPLASGCFMLVRTPLFVELGGFDPRFFMYFEDYDLSLRVGRHASVAYVPGARIVHHGGEASHKGLRHVAWFVTSAFRFFARHGWKLA